jgi:hypothetical protein
MFRSVIKVHPISQICYLVYVMKPYSLLVLYLLMCSYSFGQVREESDAQTDTQKHIVLTDVVINARRSEAGKYAKKIKSSNVYMIINPDNRADEYLRFWSTLCKPLNKAPIKIYTVELKLAPYDSSLFDMKLIVAQVQSTGDTFFRVVDIDAEQIARKQLVMDVKKENIVLEPSHFYIGYDFRPKGITAPYRYRIYCNDKGDGAIISLKGNKIIINKMQDFDYNFPFKISYITL